MERINYSSGAVWEEIVGYSRAVKIGNVIEVTGTVAVDDDNKPVAVGDAYEQAKFIIGKIEKTLARAGASLNDIVRTRMFVTDISRWQEYGKAHGEFFRDVRPVATMVEVTRLISPEMLVEIEVEAIIAA